MKRGTVHDNERFGMPEGQVLEFSEVTKRFGGITAVSGFSARVEPGQVTGFLGPNGAGKTTTLRILLGLVRATSGTATVGGVAYAKLANPLQTVGAVLEASSFHPGRTAANHLRVYARAGGIGGARVDEVLGQVGLSDAAGRKVGGFSLGMRQRLGLAYALLGDPGVLVLDEPSNGLDPEGIKWMRGFLRQLAREGRTVLVSSHMLTEVQQTVDALLVISGGRLVFQGGLEDLVDPSEYATVVDAPDRAALTSALDSSGVSYELLRSGLTVRGTDPAGVGQLAAGAGIALSSLQRKGPALEEVFLELVSGQRVHASAGGTAPVDSAPEAVAAAAVVAPVLIEDARDEASAAVNIAERESVAVVETATEEAPDASAPTTAGFVVASTGVIDIITPEEAAAYAASGSEPEAEAEAEATGDADGYEGEPVGPIDDELDSDISSDIAKATDSDPDDGLDGEQNLPERPFDEYPKTESDLQADAFFAAFDAEAQAAEEARAAESEDSTEDGEESDGGDDPPPAEQSGAENHDHEGGELR
ncbi:ABC transporter ATP-binding protein [Microbacterium lacus]|uniref:ABC transporter ATP-binding protein n=1 Tax=Microbacterium lacus TaxID=415217 RepID=UPI00384FEED8